MILYFVIIFYSKFGFYIPFQHLKPGFCIQERSKPSLRLKLVVFLYKSKASNLAKTFRKYGAGLHLYKGTSCEVLCMS